MCLGSLLSKGVQLLAHLSPDSEASAHFEVGMMHMPLKTWQEGSSLNTAHFFCSRGVLQALIEKQFPAADRRRVADLFGIDSDASDKMSDRSSPALGQGTPKRRRQQG